MQIIFGRIIIDTQGKIVELEFNSPFVYLMSLWDGMQTRSPTESENQAEVSGVLSLHSLPSSSEFPLEPSTIAVEQFLEMLRFPQRGKLQKLVTTENVSDLLDS